MNRIKLYTDEDIFGQVAEQLRRRSYDVLSTPEAGNLELSDQEQLEFAISQRRAILTFNRGDFSQLHYEYLAAGRQHYGIIVSPQMNIGRIVKCCLNLLAIAYVDDLINQIEYLNDWE